MPSGVLSIVWRVNELPGDRVCDPWHKVSPDPLPMGIVWGMENVLEQVDGPKGEHGEDLQPPRLGGRPTQDVIYHVKQVWGERLLLKVGCLCCGEVRV